MNNLQKLIKKIYKNRQKAHDILLQCDIELDKIIKELYKNKH
jgi:hypothetical protein